MPAYFETIAAVAICHHLSEVQSVKVCSCVWHEGRIFQTALLAFNFKASLVYWWPEPLVFVF